MTLDTLFEVARYWRLWCSRLPAVIDMQLAGGEAVDTVSARGEVVDTQPTQEGRGMKAAQGR